MAEEKKQEKEITLTFKTSELFQLHLSVLARLGAVQQKYCNAYCGDEQKSAETLLLYLSNLDTKLGEALKNG